MDENKAVELKNVNFYKIGFVIVMILLAFFLGVVFHAKFVSASWPLNKQATCTMLNVSGDACDSSWCDIIDCQYNATKQACICTITNTTIVTVNNVTSISLNLTDFYNKTEVANLLSNLSNYKDYTDNKTKELRDTLVGRIENESSKVLDLSRNSGYVAPEKVSPWVYVAGLLIVMAGIVGMVYLNKNKKQEEEEPTFSVKRSYRDQRKEKKEPKEEPESEEEQEPEEKPAPKKQKKKVQKEEITDEDDDDILDE